jgi:hypothetical protein
MFGFFTFLQQKQAAIMPYPFIKSGHPLKHLLCCIALLYVTAACAQLKWDGEAGDGQWNSPGNWTGNTLPSATDDVLLDNSIVSANYTVVLPPGTAAVTIKSIVVSPAAAGSIQLTLPAASNAAPAFVATGPGYGITLNSGAVLLNASGATSALALAIADSFRINNGAQYIHNTRSAHAALVSILSRQPGTEKGVFTFDVPGGGYTIASTNRVYGTLELSAAASGGVQVYATSAANPFTINGDLLLRSGTTFNLDITAPTVIHGNCIQEGGVFNLASQSNNNTVFVKGDLRQTSGTITETAGGLPAIEFNGNAVQNLRLEGAITNSVDCRFNNTQGFNCLSDITLPFHASLLNGIVHTQSFKMVLQNGAGLQADSLSGSFIDGRLRKEGLSTNAHFLFPVGKGITQRWLALKNATGNFTVEFFKINPNIISAFTGPGIHHISSIEYWSVQADAAPAPAAAVELSFDNVNSGGVTDMATLRVAQLVAGVWTNAGNTATTGTAGSAGSVLGNALSSFETTAAFFSLSSSDAFQNPLPLQLLSFRAFSNSSSAWLQWTVAPSWKPGFFELQSSANGIRFERLAIIEGRKDQQLYGYSITGYINMHVYYRLKMVEQNGPVQYSANRQLALNSDLPPVIAVRPSVVFNGAHLFIRLPLTGTARIRMLQADGRLVKSFETGVQKGDNLVPLETGFLKPGFYTVQLITTGQQVYTTRFVKM